MPVYNAGFLSSIIGQKIWLYVHNSTCKREDTSSCRWSQTKGSISVLVVCHVLMGVIKVSLHL